MTKKVAPARERGLKSSLATLPLSKRLSRSRKGAWIEIEVAITIRHNSAVAPARERGLKSERQSIVPLEDMVAPARERGLKYFKAFIDYTSNERRSRKGAWIEMLHIFVTIADENVAPARERGLKCLCVALMRVRTIVAPARERGLKFE